MIYIVFYKHSVMNIKDVSKVFTDKAKAEAYKKMREADNECAYATWEIEDHEVTE